jgi:hypothetical protein
MLVMYLKRALEALRGSLISDQRAGVSSATILQRRQTSETETKGGTRIECRPDDVLSSSRILGVHVSSKIDFNNSLGK